MNYLKCKETAAALLATSPRYYRYVQWAAIINAARQAIHDKPGATVDELHRHIKRNYI